MRVIVDTNILIDHLKSRSDIFNQLVAGVESGEVELMFPSMVAFELYAGKETGRKKELAKVEQLWAFGQIVDATLSIAKEAGFLLRDYQQLPSAVDAVIAATALELDAEIATQNLRHFKGIKGLKLLKK